MEEPMQSSVSIPSSPAIVDTRHSAANTAFRVLHAGFIIAPVVAGLDKFTHMLVNWDQYLAPQVARLSPIGAHGFMMVVGVIEVIAGLLVALRPKIGGLVVAAWLLGIIGNLLIQGAYFDIALRDFGLALGAFALSRLALARERGEFARS
jgi:hypothetical protein